MLNVTNASEEVVTRVGGGRCLYLVPRRVHDHVEKN